MAVHAQLGKYWDVAEWHQNLMDQYDFSKKLSEYLSEHKEVKTSVTPTSL